MTTYPVHWLDWLLWPILRLLWEPFSQKKSHWWHWRVKKWGCVPSITIGPAETAKSICNAWDNLIQRNFGWKTVAIIRPKINDRQRYQIGFFDPSRPRKKHLCSIVLQGSCAVLVGPVKYRFFAVSYPNWEPLEFDSYRLGPDQLIRKADLRQLGNVPLV